MSKQKYTRMTKRKSPIGKDHPLAKQHIRVGLKDRPDTIKRIPRLKMTAKNLKAVYGVEVHYLRDDTGNVLFPTDWRVKCLPPPVLYTIKQKPKKYTEIDALEDPNYDGSATLCLLDVPMDVDEEVLDVFLRAGLEDEDPDYQGACTSVSESEKKLQEINMKLQNIPFLQIKEATSAKEEQAERLTMSNFLQVEKKRVETLLKEERRRKRTLKRKNETEKILLTKVRDEESTKTSVWHVNFDKRAGNADARATIILKKDDWYDLRLFRGLDSSNPPKIDIIRGQNVRADLDTHREINVRGIKFVRRRYGKGMLKISDNEYVEGTWDDGEAKDIGTIYSKFCQYDGTLRETMPFGQGKLVLRNGVHLEGTMKAELKHVDTEGNYLKPLLGQKRYHMGVPHGDNIKVQFPDGSKYVGTFRDGRITGGHGKYTDANGVRVEGNFLDGKLHGKNCKVTYKKQGKSFAGEFERGKLNGHGVYKSKHCIREGKWLNGDMHGMGFEHRERFRYSGMWKNGQRHGLGTMMFDTSPLVQSEKSHGQGGNPLDGKTYHEKKYAHVYDCIWNSGRAGIFGSRMHTSRRRPEGTYYYADHYMHTKCERVKHIHEDETKRRNDFVSSDLRRLTHELRERKEKFHFAKKQFVESFKSKQKDLESRLLGMERARKMEIRRKRDAEREAKRLKAEEDAKVFERMRKMIVSKTKEENEGVLVEKED